MNDQAALLAAILSDPADDTARLVFADWLDENGHQERAEFIRVQVGLARHECFFPSMKMESCQSFNQRNKTAFLCHLCKPKAALLVRELELLDEHGAKWLHLKGVDGMKILNGPKLSYVLPPTSGSTVRRAEMIADFSRGFVSRVTCASADWLAHADSLYWHPGQREWGPHPSRKKFLQRIPRPVPPGAQPIEQVVLTTPPLDGWGAPDTKWASVRLPDGRTGWGAPSTTWASVRLPDGRTELTDGRWPGIVFELPPVRSLDFNDIQDLLFELLPPGVDVRPHRGSI